MTSDESETATDPISEFFARFVAPPLINAGYRRSRRVHFTKSSGPDRLCVDVLPKDMGRSFQINVQFGIVTQAWTDWRERAWPKASSLIASDGVVWRQLFAPLWAASEYLPFGWNVSPETYDEVGEALTAALESLVVPTLESWLQPQTRADDIAQNPEGQFTLLPPGPKAVALALVGSSEVGKLEELLATLPADDPFTSWAREYSATIQR